MNYKEVFQLAQEKGYKFYFEWDNPYKRTYKHLDDWKAIDQEIITSNPLLVLAELTLIQKWLRDEHEIIVVPNTFDKGWLEAGKWCYQFSIADKTDSDENRWISAKEYPTWEEALLEGITGALKLLP